jgi:hypothetical protein
MTTAVPTGPLVGLKLVIAGADSTVNMMAEEAVPPEVVTDTAPVVVLAATVAVTCVELLTVKLAAALPPKETAVAPVRFAPVIVTVVPVAPEVGLKVVIDGLGVFGVGVVLPPLPQAVRIATSSPMTTRGVSFRLDACPNKLHNILIRRWLIEICGGCLRAVVISHCFRARHRHQGSESASQNRPLGLWPPVYRYIEEGCKQCLGS